MKFALFRKDEVPAEAQAILRAETVDKLYRQASLGIAATVINSAVLSFIQWDVVPHGNIILWFSCLMAAAVYRSFTIRRFRAAAGPAADMRAWEKRFVAGMTLVGIVWGAGGVLLFPVSSTPHQAFLAFVIGGMVAGAAGTFSLSFKAFLAFSLPAITPVALCFFRLGDAVHIAMGSLTLLFAVMISSVAMRVHLSWVSSAKLRFENENLVAYLATAKEGADKLNEKLLSEIGEREKAEQALQRHHERLEELVRDRTAELSLANELLQKEIAARKEAEATLAKNEEHFRTLIENTLDIITVLDDRGIILFESPSVTKLLGYDPVELVDKSVFEFLHPDDLSEGRKVLGRLIAAPGTSDAIEVRFRHRDGSWHVIDARGKSVGDAAQGMRVIINSRDTTERRKLESEVLRAQKLDSLGTLAGGIAHDFNNFITGITANIELAKLRAENDAELQGLLIRAGQASVRAKDLTQQLLTFSHGGDPLKKAVPIGPLLREAVGFALRGSMVACEFSLPENLPAVEGDEGLLRQALHNVVINAVQAMPRGGMMTVAAACMNPEERAASPLAPGDYVAITIRDRGVGIPKEHLPLVFDPFFTTKQAASGLGLSTSYSIVKKHGGDISVASENGAGTTVTLHLPVSKAKAEPRAESVGIVIGTGRILIMDDEDIIRDAARKILEAAGYEVETVEDGAEAIACYRKARDEGRPFQAVILDLTVPGGTGGRETVKKLLELDPGVKAIVSSGYSSDPIMANYRDYGFRGVIAKPYRVREMSEIVKQVVRSS